MLDRVKGTLFRAITTTRGDSLAAVRIPKEVARYVNSALGHPLATTEELSRRAEARALLATLRAPSANKTAVPPREPAPVLVYFQRDRNVRELVRIEELLAARGIAFKRLDVTGDQPMTEFVTRAAKCERDELPVVFVADRAIGPFPALVEADVSGELARLVRG
ncbi:MAG: hypothetical protein WBY94_12605 [Polyangiaceae bacterium]